MQVVTKSNMKAAKNQGSSLPPDPEGRNINTPNAATTMTAKFHNVTRAPPRRSDNHPPSGRTKAPSKGPTNAHRATPAPGNSADRRIGNAARIR